MFTCACHWTDGGVAEKQRCRENDMSPIAKITKEMIVNAGFDIAREYGIENVNARTVSEKLDCSTQPVMYHFKKIEDMKKAVYQKADQYHTTYITDIQGDNQMLEMGLLYIRFAQEEKNLELGTSKIITVPVCVVMTLS